MNKRRKYILKSIILKLSRESVLLLLLFMFMFSLMSCKTRVKKRHKIKTEFTADSILKEFSLHALSFDTFDSKLNTIISNNENKYNLSTNIRIKKDSIIWISVSAIFGIEVARIVITEDSVKMLNRIENTYLLAENKYLKTLFNVDIDYAMLESVLTGNDFPHFEKDKFELQISEGFIELTAKNRKKEKNISAHPLASINQLIRVDKENYKILRNYFNDNEQSYTFDVLYSNFKNVSGQVFAFTNNIKLGKDNQGWDVTLEYSRINLNGVLTFPFSIPDKYKNLNDK